MIFDRLEYAHHYFGLNKDIDFGLKYLLSFDAERFSFSRLEFGNGISVASHEEKTLPENERKYEAHKSIVISNMSLSVMKLL
jgi:beta-galactosidase beta subunit